MQKRRQEIIFCQTIAFIHFNYIKKQINEKSHKPDCVYITEH